MDIKELSKRAKEIRQKDAAVIISSKVEEKDDRLTILADDAKLIS